MSDFIDKWQRTIKPTLGPTLAKDDGVKLPAPSPEPTAQNNAPGEEDDEKKPTRYRLDSVELRPSRGLWSQPSYVQLIDVLFDGNPASFIALLYFHQVVVVKGRNLQSIVAGLRMRTQWIIEQHDEAKHEPRAKNEPEVEHMEFITEDIPAVIAALRAGTFPAPKKSLPAHTGAARVSA
jgi:hypothetical protein